jgi:hypothetical protein
MLIHCQECDAEISEHADACPKCSAQKIAFLGEPIRCDECGNDTFAAFAICQKCGAPLKEHRTEADPVDAPSLIPDASYKQDYEPTKSFPQEAPKGGTLRFFFAFCAFALAFAGAAYLVNSGNVSGASLKPRLTEPKKFELSDFEASIAGTEIGQFYIEFKSAFPEEYDQMISGLAEQAGDGSTPDDQMFKLGYERMQMFMAANADYIFSAPEPILAELADRRHLFFVSLQKVDVDACGALSLGKSYHSKALQDLFVESADFSTLAIRALVAGKTSPVDRLIATDDQWGDFMLELMGSGLSEDAVSELTLRDPEDYSASVACEIAVGMYKKISELPDEESAFWLANLEVSN